MRDHPPQTFETREAFLNHMVEAHPGRFRKEQLPFIAESSARPLNPTVPACPFCAEESGDLENHVAQHLCHFALQSLPWPDRLDQGSENISGQETNSSNSGDIERETLKDNLNDSDDDGGFIDADWRRSLDLEPEPLLDTPVSWLNIGRVFSETDQVLSEFAAHAARYAIMAPNDNHAEPETIDEEILQVTEHFPDVGWEDADINLDGQMLRASLQGPWGFKGEHIVLNVRVTIPHDYPEAQAPSFLIGDSEHMPEVVREKLPREVHEICQLYLQRKKTCLAAVFSYLLGLRDLTSIIDMFDVKGEYSAPLEDVDENNPPASPVAQQDAIEFAEVADDKKAIEPAKPEYQPKFGYLTKRGKNFGGWKSRFYVVDGPQLKYSDVAGGAQLGSIQLHGAQIGKRRQDDTASDIDKHYDHAMLIVESKRGSEIRHVLCAESDEERDLWVEALLPWTTVARNRPRVSESQTGTPLPPTFLMQMYGKSGQFYPVNHPAPYVSISSATIASCPIDCRLNVSKTEFGTFYGVPAGIIYMDIVIGAPHRNLKSVTITAILDDKDPDLQRADQVASANAYGGLDGPVTLTHLYGPKDMADMRAGEKTIRSSSQGWRISSRLPQSEGSQLYRSLCWDIIPNDLDDTSLRTRLRIHTGFLFQGGAQRFSLKVEIEGKSSKISDRIGLIQLARANKKSSKWGKILLNRSNEHLHRPLDELANALPEAMNTENELQVPVAISNAYADQLDALSSGHGRDEYIASQENSDTVNSSNTKEGGGGSSRYASPYHIDTVPERASSSLIRRVSRKVLVPGMPRVQTFTTQQDGSRDRLENVQSPTTEGRVTSVGRELHELPD